MQSDIAEQQAATQAAIAERQNSTQMLSYALSILAQPVNNGNGPLRDWARGVVSRTIKVDVKRATDSAASSLALAKLTNGSDKLKIKKLEELASTTNQKMDLYDRALKNNEPAMRAVLQETAKELQDNVAAINKSTKNLLLLREQAQVKN